MSEPRHPHESPAYRKARDELLKAEQELVEKTKAVAALRRKLPPGGELKQDYVFHWATERRLGQKVRFAELFGGRSTLLIYSFMFGPNWDKPCPSCTSLMDGLDRAWYSVDQSGAAFVAIAKAPAEKIHAWARVRGWSQIPLVSGAESAFQADYKCQRENDDMQWPVMLAFRKIDGRIHLSWSTENMSNHVDTVWPYWNLMDFTPDGRPDRTTPPQNFRSEFLERHYLSKE